MSNSNLLTVLYVTCQKYSDLWQSISMSKNLLFEQYGINSIVVSDLKDDDSMFNNIINIESGINSTFSKRILDGLNQISTPFVLLMLDDYFVLKKRNFNIDLIINYCSKNNIDYCRMYKSPSKGKPINKYFKSINIEQKYALNTHPSIWNKELLAYAASENLEPWDFEKKLSRIPINFPDKKYIMLRSNYFPFIELVIGGKYFKRSVKIAQKNNLTLNSREIYPFFKKINGDIKRNIRSHLPIFIQKKYLK